MIQPAYAKATGNGRAADMAKLENQILMAKLIQSGAYIDKNGQLVGSPAQLQKELDKQNRLNELEDKKRGLLEPGLAPEPPELEEDEETAPGGINRTVRQGYRQAAIALRGASLGLNRFGKRLNTRLGRVPTPGGMWVPIVIVLVLWLAIIPVNGHTRMKWLWMVYMGDAALSLTNQTPQAPSSAPTSSSPPILLGPPGARPESAQIGTQIAANNQQLLTLQDLFGGNTTSFLTVMNGAYGE